MLLFFVTAASAHCLVVINEFLPDPLGGDSQNEWVELLNAGDDPCDLTGYTLQAGSSGFNTMLTFEAVTVEAGRFVWIGPDAADVPANLTMGNASTNADGLRLLGADGMVVDVGIYGSPNDDGWTDESGIPVLSTAPSPYGGASLGRCPDGYDSNQAGVDFVSFPVPTPGGRNDMSEPCTFVDTGVIDTGDTADTAGSDTADSGAADTGPAAPEDTADTADTGGEVVVERPCGCDGGSSGPAAAAISIGVALLSRRLRYTNFATFCAIDRNIASPSSTAGRPLSPPFRMSSRSAT